MHSPLTQAILSRGGRRRGEAQGDARTRAVGPAQAWEHGAVDGCKGQGPLAHCRWFWSSEQILCRKVGETQSFSYTGQRVEKLFGPRWKTYPTQRASLMKLILDEARDTCRVYALRETKESNRVQAGTEVLNGSQQIRIHFYLRWPQGNLCNGKEHKGFRQMLHSSSSSSTSSTSTSLIFG